MRANAKCEQKLRNEEWKTRTIYIDYDFFVILLAPRRGVRCHIAYLLLRFVSFRFEFEFQIQYALVQHKINEAKQKL